MKLNYQQLALHLKNHLLPIYMLSGDEYLLVQEARDLIQSKAKNQGFTEIQRFEANKDFDWNKLFEATQSLSLFNEKIFIEIKLSQKPNAQDAKLFSQVIENIHPDYVVVILSEKLDATAQKTNWFNLILNKGAHITIWPLDLPKFQDWVKKRLKQFNLQLEEDAIQFLVSQTEGNLLACAQEIEKLALVFSGQISLSNMVEAIGDSAHYDIFNFTDAILDRNAERALRILSKLRQQAIEPTLILWAIMREIRLLFTVKLELKNKIEWASICKKNQIWDKKQPLVKRAVSLISAEDLSQLLLLGGKIDRMIKGLIPGNIWNELQIIVLALSGIK